jgi:hypothetical protein
MRDSLRPSSARVPRTTSFRKLTRSRAISTASRSLDAPRDVLASSSRRGSSQNALRTFPIRVARGLDVVTRDRDERRPVFESRRLDVVGIDCRYFVRQRTGYRTYGHHRIERPSISSDFAVAAVTRAVPQRLSWRDLNVSGIDRVQLVGASGFEPPTPRSRTDARRPDWRLEHGLWPAEPTAGLPSAYRFTDRSACIWSPACRFISCDRQAVQQRSAEQLRVHGAPRVRERSSPRSAD